MNITVSHKNDVMVMSSVDLAGLCVGDAKDSHSNFMKKAAKVLGDGVVNFYDTYLSVQGKELQCLMLPEREACLMAMSYSYELQAWVYDQWQAKKVSKPALPDFANPVAAARAWADAVEQKQAVEQQLAIAAPKAEFVDRYVQSTGNLGFRQVAKLLKIKENDLRELLISNHVMYRLAGSLTPYAEHIDAGRFEVKTGMADHGDTSHAYQQAKFTPKGVEWLAGELAKADAKKQLEVM